MSTKYSCRKSIILGIIVLSLLVSSVLPIGVSVTIDEDDGIWTDTFLDDGNVMLAHCEVSDGSIILKEESSNQTYDFANAVDNTAYSYKTPFFMVFLPPNFHIPLEEKFTNIGYAKIKQKDGDTVTSEGSLLKKVVVHHFRFKINLDPDFITQLDLSWRGKAEDDQKVSLYYWQPIGNLGIWEETKSNMSNGAFIELTRAFTGDLFISEDNYVDLCVVAKPELGKKCSLDTDYVKIVAWGQGYAFSGTAVSSVSIDPLHLASWELFTWKDYEKSGTSIKYHVLYDNETLIEDSILPGNKNGFTTPISLISLPVSNIDKIKIQANLTTTNPSVTPRLYTWSVLWQTQENTWQDLFSSTLRVAEKANVQITGGNVQVLPFLSDWPLFGQNPANTRSSDGHGPNSSDLYWYSPGTLQVGGGYRNPVIKEGVLYIVSSDGATLYAFNATVPSGHEGSSNPALAHVPLDNYVATNTPAVTDDLIIVATSNTSLSGVENKVYAFNKSLSQVWDFDYKDVDPANPKLCYYGSPVVSDDKIFLSTWSGAESLLEFLTEGTNRLIALDLEGNWLWDKELPTGSFSSPAVSDDKVFVGCENTKNNSLYALNSETGEVEWSAAVGPIGRASPVVHDNKVFVVVKEQAIPLVSARTKVVAVNADTGKILWNVTISNPMLTTYDLAASTPAAYSDALFVASPDGTLYALDVDDGTTKWTKTVYTKSLISTQVLVSSPAYADGMVYIGTPDGVIYALDASSGAQEWMFNDTEDDSPVLSSPIVVDGLLYFSDEQGMAYSLGAYEEADEEITGSLVSIPIYLPQGHIWDRFYATMNTTSGGSIVFSILDEDKTVLVDDVENGDNISAHVAGHASIRLCALFTIEASADKASLQNWSLTMITSEDTDKPIFYETSFTPTSGWINTTTPTCRIEVQDKGQGLAVNSGEFELDYKLKGQTSTKTYPGTAHCTGSNGTTAKQTMSVDIAALDFSDNITELIRIRFQIWDLAGNTNTSQWHDFDIDMEKPFSHITNGASIPDKCNLPSVAIEATATDSISGVETVALYYRALTDTEWTLFKSDNASPYSWSFSVLSGEYELCTVATDVAGNVEDFPDDGDVSFVFDPNDPDLPDFDLDQVYWFNTTPVFSGDNAVTFSDDYLLDSIAYRPNFDVEWTLIAPAINKTTYTEPWTLATDQWEYMDEGATYSVYFNITDICGNQLITASDETLWIGKDTVAPYIDLNATDLTAAWQWDDVFNLSAFAYDGNGSGVKYLQLYYRFSEDNESWTNWSTYGDALASPPYSWEFKAEKGNGYYEFKLVAEDYAGNVATLHFAASINVFPTLLFVIMLALLILFVIIIVAVLIKLRKPRGGATE